MRSNSRVLPWLLLGVVVMLVPLATGGPTASTDFTVVEVTADHGFPEGANLAVNPEDPSTWLMASCTSTAADADIRVFKTEDGGLTWAPIDVSTDSSLRPCAISYHPTDGSRVAIGYSSGGDVKVAVSLDGGSTFDAPVVVHSTASEDYILGTWWRDLDSLGIIYIDAGTDDIRTTQSNDTGVTWDPARSQHGLADQADFAPTWFHQLKGDPDWLRVLTPEETVWSTNGGVTWNDDVANQSAATDGSVDWWSWAPITQTKWIGMAWDNNAGVPTDLVETTDAGATWTKVVDFTEELKPAGCSQGDVQTWSCAGLNQDTSATNVTWTEDGGSSYTNVTALDSSACQVAGANGCRSYGHVQPTTGQYVVAIGDDGPRTVAFSEAIAVEEPVPGPEPVDFADGLKDAVVSLGFRTERSQMFFALALVGITTVATGTALKFMGSSRVKNWMIGGAAMGVGAFMVIVFFVEFWMVLLAMVVGGAILMGPNTFLNTLSDLRREAERTVGGGPVPGSETVTDPEAPGMVDLPEDTEMVDLPEDTEMVETTAQVDVGEGAELIDVGDAEDVEV